MAYDLPLLKFLPLNSYHFFVHEPGTLSSIAAIIAGFGVAMLFFRIQRELVMAEKNEPIWIPYSDWLLIAATIISLLLVLLPIIVFSKLSWLPPAACAAAIVMVTGYIFGILAHYRLILGRKRKGPRFNPEPSEKYIVWITLLLALTVFIYSIVKSLI